MSSRKPPFRTQQIKGAAAEELVHALRTHQVDAIVGERHIMLVRLKQAEEELELSRNQLRALTASLLSIRENERIVIAREIHDELGQALTCLQLGLSWIAGKVTARQQPVQEKVRSAMCRAMAAASAGLSAQPRIFVHRSLASRYEITSTPGSNNSGKP